MGPDKIPTTERCCGGSASGCDGTLGPDQVSTSERCCDGTLGSDKVSSSERRCNGALGSDQVSTSERCCDGALGSDQVPAPERSVKKSAINKQVLFIKMGLPLKGRPFCVPQIREETRKLN